MPVNKDDSGRRWVQAEVEVPGTPDEVWQAIASGPGISSWFVPTTLDGREGGAVKANFGPGMDSVSTIKVWDPPHRFVADSRDAMAPGDPAIATEWIVEACAGGTCVVRVVHSWFTDSDTWDNQFEGHSHGWVSFFRILRLYLAHFSGRPCTSVQLMGISSKAKADAWATLTGSLGLGNVAVGQTVHSAPSAPPFVGTVERVGEDAHPEDLLLCLEEPAGGIAHLFAMSMAGKVYLSIRLFLYGDSAPAAAAEARTRWQAFLDYQFPAEEAQG